MSLRPFHTAHQPKYPIWGSRLAESELAVSRAEAVIDYFTDELGIRRDLFETADRGNGEFMAEAAYATIFRRVER